MTEPSPPTVPALHACVSCELPVQSGDGPGGLAWHDCEWVQEQVAARLPPPPKPPPGMSVLLERITQSISARVDGFNARDLATVLEALAALHEAEKTSASSTENASLRLLALVSAD